MTNFEKYSKILETPYFGLTDEHLASCYDMDCETCKFRIVGMSCGAKRWEWLKEVEEE